MTTPYLVTPYLVNATYTFRKIQRFLINNQCHNQLTFYNLPSHICKETLSFFHPIIKIFVSLQIHHKQFTVHLTPLIVNCLWWICRGNEYFDDNWVKKESVSLQMRRKIVKSKLVVTLTLIVNKKNVVFFGKCNILGEVLWSTKCVFIDFLGFWC